MKFHVFHVFHVLTEMKFLLEDASLLLSLFDYPRTNAPIQLVP
jgi:hypothetical protein